MSNIFDLFKQIENECDKRKNSRIEYAIIGLGNPGDKYVSTRHNMGFMAIDYISQKLGIKINKLKFRALINEALIGNHRVILAKPQTFMNNSGESVKEICDFYKLDSKHIIVIYDDMCLDYGKMRIREKGSHGGHNGIRNIIDHLKCDDFMRIKIGVGIPNQGEDIINYVLSQIPKSKQEDVYKCIEKTYDCVELMTDNQVQKAMNLYN